MSASAHRSIAMLFTRCPECETTFRITAEALTKAGGQVRCGRCASVFDAYAQLREQREQAVPDDDADWLAAAEFFVDEPPAFPEGVSIKAPGGERNAVHDGRTPAPMTPLGLARPAVSSEADTLDDIRVAAVLEQIESSDVRADASAPAWSQAEKRKPLRNIELPAPPAPSSSSPWQMLEEVSPASRKSRLWSYAALVALLVLGLQVTNHFRSDLVGSASIGPLLRKAYASVGIDLIPRWDIKQYRIVDWVASAEPGAGGHGGLKITARIQNGGPRAQPFPYVHLQLKDRWEKSVAKRIFRPAEYLPAGTNTRGLMPAGATARAELDVVDPGPDAYGFELDVCIERPNHSLQCANDKVFR
ncbi:MAG TPA: zinc-ribbon and DUF3426 domain-containing protein [Gammaproteobacteria bacterium]|nr:zinc-ribbon and DUF3426 domain-containing protein [Gammaproteobacteria bacterium]